MTDDKIRVKPFSHDCKGCEWAGWTYHRGRWGNMYVCSGDGGTVLIRYSDEPSDYWSVMVGTRKYDLDLEGEEAKEYIGKRDLYKRWHEGDYDSVYNEYELDMETRAHHTKMLNKLAERKAKKEGETR